MRCILFISEHDDSKKKLWTDFDDFFQVNSINAPTDGRNGPYFVQ